MGEEIRCRKENSRSRCHRPLLAKIISIGYHFGTYFAERTFTIRVGEDSKCEKLSLPLKPPPARYKVERIWVQRAGDVHFCKCWLKEAFTMLPEYINRD